MANPLVGQSGDNNVPGVKGENTAGGAGVSGSSPNGIGVSGETSHPDIGSPLPGVKGKGTVIGVWGEALGFGGAGVHGTGHFNCGVYGEGFSGVVGVSTASESYDTSGVHGKSEGNAVGVRGTSRGNDAVLGISSSSAHAGVSAVNDGGGFGLWARGNIAGHFEGDVEVYGDIRLMNADCAEEFDITGTETLEPGTVMVINHDGALRQSETAYDKRVAGVISGAGDCKPGIILGKQSARANRRPIALVGKVYCKADASYAPIEVGDLLTTSPTPGSAMKADDPLKAFGAVIGKALRPLREGQGLIPILIALQ